MLESVARNSSSLNFIMNVTCVCDSNYLNFYVLVIYKLSLNHDLTQYSSEEALK
jgi:hypothetical protein